MTFFCRCDELFGHDEHIDVMTCFAKFLTSWRSFDVMTSLLDVMTYFWRHDERFNVVMYFWRYDELFDVMTYFWRNNVFLTSWSILDIMTCYLRQYKLLALWHIFDVMTNLFDVMIFYFFILNELFGIMKCFGRYDKLLTSWRIFDVITKFLCHDVFLTSCRIFNIMMNLLLSCRTFNVMTYFELFWRHDVIFMSWHTLCMLRLTFWYHDVINFRNIFLN